MKKFKDLVAILKANPQLLFLFSFVITCVIVFFLIIIITFSSRPNNNLQNLTQEQQEQIQAEEDKTFSKIIYSAQEKYPWFENLPPKNSKYFVAFDEAEQAFYVSLYVKNNLSQQEDYKQQVYLDLKQIGVATESYKFNWFVR